MAKEIQLGIIVENIKLIKRMIHDGYTISQIANHLICNRTYL